MHASDVLAKKTAEAQNDLETYIYRVRDLLDYSWSDYVAEGPKSEFSALLGTMENWLYDEGCECDPSGQGGTASAALPFPFAPSWPPS